jgi:hypothetical protein
MRHENRASEERQRARAVAERIQALLTLENDFQT